MAAAADLESSLELSLTSSGAVAGGGLPPARSRIFKIIVIGDSNVGKTCLTYRFCAGRFPQRTEATIGVDFRERAVTIDGERIKVPPGRGERAGAGIGPLPAPVSGPCESPGRGRRRWERCPVPASARPAGRPYPPPPTQLLTGGSGPGLVRRRPGEREKWEERKMRVLTGRGW